MNSIGNTELNRNPPYLRKPQQPLHTMLEQHSFFDTFRTLHPERKEFSYKRPIQFSNEITQSQLDYIYTDQETTSYNTIKAYIKDTRETLTTDHKMSLVLLDTTDWAEFRAQNEWKQANRKNINKWDFTYSHSVD